MPLKKESSSVSLPTDGVSKEQHPLKRKQPLSFDATAGDAKLSSDLTKNRLIRSNDLLTQTPTEVLLELLKAYAGVKECAEETQVHLYMVRLLSCDAVPWQISFETFKEVNIKRDCR